MDAVLDHRRPNFDERAAVEIAESMFAISADRAVNLGSERDQAFMLWAGSHPVGVVKISNAAEQAAVLDMEALAAVHISHVDTHLPVAIPRIRKAADGIANLLPTIEDRRALLSATEQHWVRLYDVMPGRARSSATTLDDRALSAWGSTTARLGRALQGFFHPSGQRTMLWDVQHAEATRPMTASIRDTDQRRLVVDVLDRFRDHVAPRWRGLRAQMIHGDLTTDNALVDSAGQITGIVDFGDMSHSALITDLASILDSLTTGRRGDELVRVARLVIDGYQRFTPLEPAELALLGQVWAARAAIGVTISSWRSAQGFEDAEFAQRYNDEAIQTIEYLLQLGWARLETELTGAGNSSASDPPANRSSLIHRRAAVFGPALEALSYHEPLEVASAYGTWITDTAGRQYLDMYNNVPCVGHSHPRVAQAIARQSRLIATNMRYLHSGAIELAERLIRSCADEPDTAHLDTVLFVNSGSEANDLAWRLAVAHTGNSGALCTSFAYHGISAAIADMSPEVLPDSLSPAHVGRWNPPDTYRGTNVGTESFVTAISRLASHGHRPAIAILDGVLQSDGIYDLDPQYVRQLVDLTHAAGGLWVADEVQGGHGRTGEKMWSCQRFGIRPDFITLGKPMGNGQPIAAVITTREICASFADQTVLFSTFGGNQVSVAAATAVLDVIADERILPRVVIAGETLRSEVRAALADISFVGDVRGIGLANAIEVVADRSLRTPDPQRAQDLKEQLRMAGVLVGTTGPAANIIKVRPPLAFTAADVATFVDRLAIAVTRCEV